MKKIKIRIVVEVEYEPDEENYPECSTEEEMLAVDIECANEYPYMFLDMGSSNFEVTGEVI